MKEIKIPEERIGVIIGEDGETKEEFQNLTETELEINNNTVKVEGEPLDEMTGQKIVKAIGRGANPDQAFKLLEENHTLHIIDISDYAETRNSRDRLKGRVIGRSGETKRHIQKETQTELAIYGKTITIIGKASNIEIAMEAIRMLLQGSSHATAYNYIEKNQHRIQH